MSTKKSVKITKEQYNRIFASNLLKENFSMEEPMIQEVKPETLELIKSLYQGMGQLPPFWSDNGLTYEEICEYLLNKGLIVAKEGNYEVPKTLGDPQTALQQIQDALSEVISEPETEITGQETPMVPEPSLEEEFEEETLAEINGPLSTIASNEELSIVSDGSNLFVFNYSDMSMEPLSDEELNNFVDLNPNQVGYGLDSWIEGRARLIQIDDALKQELEIMYDQDPELINALSPVEEEVEPMISAVIPEVPQGPLGGGNRVIEKLKQLKQEEELGETLIANPQELEEMTSAGSSATGGSSGPFTAPLSFGKDEEDIVRKSIPIVAEMTDTSSSGPYDANALPGISRDGSFKKTKKTPAETKTQWADGGFVEFNDCTKLNNKTSSTGCSGGAVDNVVSVKKTKGNINAPSLNEMRALITISQKTGKSIQEIKTIIESKKPKA